MTREQAAAALLFALLFGFAIVAGNLLEWVVTGG